MSFGVTSYYCDTCDFEQWDSRVWGRREYFLGEGYSVQLEWDLGWCEDCHGLAAVEVLSEAQRRAELEKAESELAALGFRPGPRWWEFPWTWQSKLEKWKEIAPKAHDAKLALQLILDRKTPPRCLACGSEHVIAPLETDKSEWIDYSQPKRIGFLHPGCGGELWKKKSDTRLAFRRSVLLYTPNGQFIKQNDLEDA